MAQQKGILPLRGTIGNITFYKSKDGYLAREKGGIDAQRMATDPAFQRTRENGAEFGRAGKAGKVLRNAVRGLLQNASDSKMTGRLTREMIKVIQADVTSSRGLRNVIDGEATLLLDFDFNTGSKLSATLYAPFTSTINRVTGILSTDIPAFVPANMLAAPGGATHYRIHSAGVEIDFEQNNYVVETGVGTALPLDNDLTAATVLTHQLPANSTHPLFLLLGLDFLQEVNGTMYPLKNGAFNALSIVNISGT
jgi:hypothetical protein